MAESDESKHPLVEWTDIAIEPPQGRVLWVYFDGGTHFARVEMATYGKTTGWFSALSPDVEFNAEAICAWSEIHYPAEPVRRWEAPQSGRKEHDET